MSDHESSGESARPTIPQQKPLSLIHEVLAEGGPGFCQFAINNACNAGCDFCSFDLDALPRKDWVFASLEKSRQALDILA